MPKRRVTSRQVAKKAGVSQTTVSFVLNNVESANISQDTRERVLQAMRDLNYVPDVAARSLAKGHTMNVGLVLVQPHNQVFIDEYIPNILTGLSQVTRQYGYRILVELIEDGSDPNAFGDLIQSKAVGGMIVNHSFPTPDVLQRLLTYAEDGFPIVALDNWHPDIASVKVDKFAGVRKVVQHLVDLGHQRIACISYAPKGHDRHVQTREDIYREVLAENGLTCDENLLRYGAYDPETGYLAMQSLLNEVQPLPTALYAMNDMMAFGAMTAIQERGLRIPDDIAVTGFDDVRLARFATPALTTIYEPDIEHGRRAGELLFALINKEPPAHKHVVLDTELIIRDSCGYCRQQP